MAMQVPRERPGAATPPAGHTEVIATKHGFWNARRWHAGETTFVPTGSETPPWIVTVASAHGQRTANATFANPQGPAVEIR